MHVKNTGEHLHEHQKDLTWLSTTSIISSDSLTRLVFGSIHFKKLFFFPPSLSHSFKKHLPATLSAPVRHNSRTLKKTPSPTCNERVAACLIVGRNLENVVGRVLFSVCRELKKQSFPSIFRSKQKRSPLQTVICPPRPPYLTQYCGCQALAIDQRRKKLLQKASSPPSLSHCHCRGSRL